ncbi:MAG: hypothetical protein EA420_04145 [Candidatus Competibacteraceae bacterium]|nr:MAG: hypothetical protein EA420_04145 [Candidatus Competibacteraceae bacterium]
MRTLYDDRVASLAAAYDALCDSGSAGYRRDVERDARLAGFVVGASDAGAGARVDGEGDR